MNIDLDRFKPHECLICLILTFSYNRILLVATYRVFIIHQKILINQIGTVYFSEKNFLINCEVRALNDSTCIIYGLNFLFLEFMIILFNLNPS